MKNLVALATVLAALLGAAQPTLAAEQKQNPMKRKPVEKARRHNHRESMQRVHKGQHERAKDNK